MSGGVRFGECGPCRSFVSCGARLAATAVGIVAAIFLLSLPASAQTEPLQITAVSAEAWPDVEATLTVFDQDGQPLTGLVQEDFSATLAGEPLPPTSLRTTSDPGVGIAIVLTFDVSGSMAGAPLEEAKIAGRALVDQLGADDQAAVVAFASDVVVAQTFTNDQEALVAAIDGLGISGDTALYGGVEESARLIRESDFDRRAMILLSDGYEFGGLSSVTREESIALARDTGALTFAVGLGPEIDQEYLSELAASGRGQFLLVPTPGDLTSAFLLAGNVLRQQYVLTLDASSLEFESETATLVIEANLAGALASASADVTVPTSAIQHGPPAATAPPPAGGVEAPQSEGGNEATSGSMPWAVILAAGAILIAGGGAVFAMRRRARPMIDDRTPVRFERRRAEVSLPEISREIGTTDAQAWLEGPGGVRVSVGEALVTIGYTADCTIVLPNGSDARQGRARVWLRDGRYMLHNLSPRLGSVSVAGRSATWIVLDDGDEISVGGGQLVFRSGNGSR